MIESDSVLLSVYIVLAVEAGDIEKLQELFNGSTLTMVEVGQQTTGCGKTVLHHAVLSRNFAMVQFVTENFKPNTDAEEKYGLTPLMLACTEPCPVEIIIYLIEQKGTKGLYERMQTSLKFAVRRNRHELTKALIAFETKIGLEPSANPLFTVVTITCDVKMLQLLLDAYRDIALTLITQEMGGWTLLEHLALFPSYDLQKKIACFKMLFKLAHPDAYASDPERYNVNDILKVAVHSTWSSSSLIPYFIETERKWEKRPTVLSLYERLLPEYELLALIVLCECGPIAGELVVVEKLKKWFASYTYSWTAEIRKLFKNATNLRDEEDDEDADDHTTDALQLLEDFASFWKPILVPKFNDAMMKAVLETYSIIIEKRRCSKELLYQPSFHRAIECMVTLSGDPADGINERLFAYNHQYYAILQFVTLRHCVTWSSKFSIVRIDRTFRRMWNWNMHLFGPWKEIEQHVGKPKLELFTLQRFARDVVRESVWKGVKGKIDAERLFLDHLQLLNIPRELNEYLRFCDYSSTKYFAKHYDALMSVELLDDIVYSFPFAF